MNSFFKGDYVSPKEAVEKLGVHFQTLRNWDKDGKIKQYDPQVENVFMILKLL
jgi:predicted site-specific integrase-resolvase